MKQMKIGTNLGDESCIDLQKATHAALALPLDLFDKPADLPDVLTCVYKIYSLILFLKLEAADPSSLTSTASCPPSVPAVARKQPRVRLIPAFYVHTIQIKELNSVTRRRLLPRARNLYYASTTSISPKIPSYHIDITDVFANIPSILHPHF